MLALNKRIKEARKHAMLTQAELSKEIGISLRALINYEKEASKITVSTVQNVAHSCKVNEAWLFTGQGEMVGSQMTTDTVGKEVVTNICEHKDVVAEHMELVKEFENREVAKDMNVDLLYIEKQSNYAFNEVRTHIKGVALGLKYAANDSSLNQDGRVVGKKERKKA